MDMVPTPVMLRVPIGDVCGLLALRSALSVASSAVCFSTSNGSSAFKSPVTCRKGKRSWLIRSPVTCGRVGRSN